MMAAAAVSDPVRRRILELLRAGDVPAGALAASFDVSRPAVSRHLRVLREAGLVRVEAVGRRRVYALDRTPLVELDGWLDQFRPLAADQQGAGTQGPAARLDALGTELRRGRRARADERRPDEPDHDAAAG